MRNGALQLHAITWPLSAVAGPCLQKYASVLAACLAGLPWNSIPEPHS